MYIDENDGKVWRIVSVTPAGRRKYGPLLKHYIESARPIIDEHHWWLNTSNPQDIAYYKQVSASDSSFYRCLPNPARPHLYSPDTIHHFYPLSCDPDTIYIRFDDDIVWMAPDAVRELVWFRLRHKAPFLIHANVVNNVICSHIHERMVAILPPVHIGYEIGCPIGHERWDVAQHIHEMLLAAIKGDYLERFKFNAWWLWGFEPCHTNCVSWFGGDMLAHGPVGVDEEFWLSHVAPEKTDRPNAICGTSLMSHFAYRTQVGENAQAGTLMNYRNLVKDL